MFFRYCGVRNRRLLSANNVAWKWKRWCSGNGEATEMDKSSIKSLSKRFYKLVHPDRFAQHPKQKEVNEHSLKQLINLINGLSGDETKTDHLHSLDEFYNLKFYLFDKQKTPKEPKESKDEPVIETTKFKIIETSFNPTPLRNNSNPTMLFEYLQTELKTTLKSLFQQAALPCNFKLDTIERAAFWEQIASEVDLRQFLLRYGNLAQERALIRQKIEQEIALYRTSFHFRKKLSVQTDLQNIMYKQQEAIEIPLQGNPTESDDFVDPIISPYSASVDVFGNEYVNIHVQGLYKLASIIEQVPASIYNCVAVISDKSETEVPYRVDSQGRIHLHYLESEEDWLKILNSIEYDQVHELTARQREIRTAENTLAMKLGVSYICASSFDVSATREYQEFIQRLIEATNKGYLRPEDFQSGLYRRMSLVVVPSDDSFTEKKFTGDSNGLIVPADCTAERLRDFIFNHSKKMFDIIADNARQEEEEVQFVHQLKRRLRLKSFKRDRFVSRRQMLHCCINMRSIREVRLIEGINFVAANFLLRVMDDGTLVIPWNFSPPNPLTNVMR